MENFNNVQFLKETIGKTAQITAIDGVFYEGQVYTIDPISKTVILYADKQNIKILSYHGIKTFQIVEATSEDYFTEEILTEDDILAKKCKLKNWFKENMVDVLEDGLVLKIKDDVVITPPYTVDQCTCANEFVLERIITLLEKMP